MSEDPYFGKAAENKSEITERRHPRRDLVCQLIGIAFGSLPVSIYFWSIQTFMLSVIFMYIIYSILYIYKTWDYEKLDKMKNTEREGKTDE